MSSVFNSDAPLDESIRLRAGSAVSWGAIFAGAVTAVALTIVLFVLGAGIGYLRDRPAEDALKAAIWLIVIQWISSALGGYITGRLRHRWLATHNHEVFFRDTAHGLCAWAAATVALALIAGAGAMRHEHSPLERGGTAGRSMVMAHATPGVGRKESGRSGDSLEYEVGKLFRSSAEPTQLPLFADAWHETEALAMHAEQTGAFSDDDRTYLEHLTARSGISADEARRRVQLFEARIHERHEQEVNETKNAAKAALLTALSMLVGAFIASVAAAIGGHLRDNHS